MIISISGDPGSGKSTVAEMLAKELGYKRYYMGGLRRQAAEKKGMTLDEYNRLGEKDFSTDKEVDDLLVHLGKKEDNFIVEGRTAFHFIPHSLKIFFDVDEKIGAIRIFSDLKKDDARNEARNLNSPGDVLKANKERMRSDQARYKKYYNLDVFDQSHYDFVVNTTNLSIQEEFEKVLAYVKSKLG